MIKIPLGDTRVDADDSSEVNVEEIECQDVDCIHLAFVNAVMNIQVLMNCRSFCDCLNALSAQESGSQGLCYMQLWYFTMLFELNRSYSVRCHGKIILNDEQLRISKEAVFLSRCCLTFSWKVRENRNIVYVSSLLCRNSDQVAP